MIYSLVCFNLQTLFENSITCYSWCGNFKPPWGGIARDATSHQELLMTLIITLIDLKDVVCTKHPRCVKSKKSILILY